MEIPFYLALFHLWIAKDTVCCMDTKGLLEFKSVTLGQSLTLKCHYDCSNAFVRACWSKASDNSDCLGDQSLTFCSVTLHLDTVSAQDLKYNYTCYIQVTDDPQLTTKKLRVVSLFLKAQTSAQTCTVAPTNMPANVQPRDSSGGWQFREIHVLATFSLAVALALTVLVVYSCVKYNPCSRNGDDDDDCDMSRSGSLLHSRVVFSSMNDSSASQNEQLTLRVTSLDDECQSEVPYAEIMISVRGVSTPELTQVSYLATNDSQQWRGCESRGHIQSSHSCDRLHIPQPREVSRKLSTNSEYAVITYA
ncbi:uncharacterized protein LOC127608388 [Hippocampus zosterae]|uniref:uncharacterized protein LOC127608388 n=1 Tax=Hippocampus zosterae TaxID=109293 RepID=UPI00223CFEF3|nr:uncharacterized protein LOC127608388 [Hippocampus zosterae]